MFTKRGFLSKVLFAGADIGKLEDVDGKLTATLRDLQVALQVESISLQRATYDEMRAANEALMQKIQSLGGAQVCRMVGLHWGHPGSAEVCLGKQTVVHGPPFLP